MNDSMRSAAAGFRVADDGQWRYSGALNFDNAAAAYAAAVNLPLPVDGVVQFDALASVDSAVVAVLLGLQRRAVAAGRRLRFIGLPPALISLATVYGVEAMLADGAGS